MTRAGPENDGIVGMPDKLWGLVQSDQNGTFYYRILHKTELLKNVCEYLSRMGADVVTLLGLEVE